MAWNDLLQELLSIIFLNLIKNNQDIPDLYQCLAVCRSWRHLAKQHLNNISTTPWLLLTQKYPNQTVTFSPTICKFHDNSRPTPNTTLSFRLIDHTKAYACCNGWLLVGYANMDFSSSTVFLYNPLSGYLLQLPPLPRHLRLDGRRGTVKFVTSETNPNDRDCIICVKFSVNDHGTILAFCKPAPSDDDYSIKGKRRCFFSSSAAYWVELEKEDLFEIEDMIFYRGEFCTIDRFGALSVYSYDTKTDVFTRKPVIVEWFNVFNHGNIATGRQSNQDYNCLVKSKSGDLLMIKRIFHKNYARLTNSCRIFKLNMSNIDYYYWSEISNLEEKEAILLGWYDCISVSVSDDNSTFKPNCIYFFDKYSSGGEVVRYGVYDLKTRTFISYADDNGVDRDAKKYECCRLFAPSGLS